MPKKPPTALILGVTGQDGSLLADLLIRQGWIVYGSFRRGVLGRLWRLDELGIREKVKLVNFNLQEPHQIIDVLSDIGPDQIYHFAGESFVADSFEQPRTVLEINTIGTLNVLEAMRHSAKDAQLFYSSSSEVFGACEEGQAFNEQSRCAPLNPYGLSRFSAQSLVDIYRRRHGLRAYCGILFNHESPYRARNFVTRKITYNMARLNVEGGDPMRLGNFDDARDWGSAVDYVSLMPRVLEIEKPCDYVFATGRATTLREFIGCAAEAAGFEPVFEGDGKSAVCIDRVSGRLLASATPEYFRDTGTPPMTGDATRLRTALNLKGFRGIDEIASEMVAADIDRRKMGRVDV